MGSTGSRLLYSDVISSFVCCVLSFELSAQLNSEFKTPKCQTQASKLDGPRLRAGVGVSDTSIVGMFIHVAERRPRRKNVIDLLNGGERIRQPLLCQAFEADF